MAPLGDDSKKPSSFQRKGRPHRASSGAKAGSAIIPLVFYPDEVIFAPTAACNLGCAHCFSRAIGPEKEALSVEGACAFLSSCLAAGREDILVGFSGGEPFLRLDFLCEVSAFAAKKGFLFSRVITNGAFGASHGERVKALKRLFGAGFDGKVALSFDSFHGQGAKAAARFIRAAIDISGDSSAAEIWSAIPADLGDEAFLGAFREAAALLGAEAPLSFSRFMKPGRFLLRGKDFAVPVYRFCQSLPAGKMRWNARRWFADDLCEGLGRCFFAHPGGDVAPCCGFANSHPALSIGRIGDGYAALLEKALSSRAVGICQGTGLEAFRKQLEDKGVKFPGKTDDQCAFCAYALERGFIA